MNGLVAILKNLYHICAFLCLLGVVLIFIFAVDIPVYDDEPFTDGSGITWRKDKGVTHGYQVAKLNSSTYNLKIYELDENKESRVVIEHAFKIDLPLKTSLKASDFSSYNGQQVLLKVPLSLK